MIKISMENTSVDDVMMKNQNDNPAVTARDLNLGDDAFILNWIDKMPLDLTVQELLLQLVQLIK